MEVLLKYLASMLGILSVIGGVLLRAYVNPVKTKTEDNHMKLSDHETRLRKVEQNQITQEVKIETIIQNVDRLVTKMDMLITLQMKTKKED